MGASSSVLDGIEMASIRLIPYEKFKTLGTTPRFPDHKDLTITIDQLTEEEYENSLIIFISHCWLRGWPGVEGWDGRPHPDNAMSSKYELCVKGIDLIREKMTENMAGCYIWMDYGCIDQDGDPAGELKQLDKIVQICDIIFTPIYDADWKSREWPSSYIDYYKDYISPHWTGTPFSYVNRGWCRIEMFYAANIPVHPDTEERSQKFKNGLAFHRKAGRRPHLLYGSQEKDGLTAFPIMLPPLQNAYFERYNPAEGELSHSSDRVKILQLVEELKPYMEKVKVGYEGEQNEKGEAHGKGKYVYPNGDIYVGDWQNGVMHGIGRFLFSSGEVYEGQWVSDMREGKGKFVTSIGDSYEGDYEKNLRHGQGTYRYATGDSYEGHWVDGQKQGKGCYRYANGDVYEGDFMDGKSHGKGVYRYANGNRYEGGFINDCKEGKGKFVWADNKDTYEGQYKDDRRHGKGKLTLGKSGKVLFQLYDDGKLVKESNKKL